MAKEEVSGLTAALKASTRYTRLVGHVPDPVARDILGSRSLVALEKKLTDLGIRGLTPLNGGASSVVLQAGDKVVRIGVGEDTTRPSIPEMLQPETHGGVGHLRYEVLPMVQTSGISQADVAAVAASLKAQGYEWSDAATDNLGRMQGKLVIIDPGGVQRTRPQQLDTDLDRIYRAIEKMEIGTTVQQAAPRAIFLGGQPGSGKSVLAGMAHREFKDAGGAVHIDADRMREQNPQYNILSRIDPKSAADSTHSLAVEWAVRLRDSAIENRRNLIIDGTLRSADNLRSIAQQLTANGYKTEARVLAVNPVISMIRAQLRFETEMAARGVGRFVNAEQHDKAYAGVVDSVVAIEKLKLVDSIKVFNAMHTVIYQNRQVNAQWERAPKASDALTTERNRPLSHSESVQYLNALTTIKDYAVQRVGVDAGQVTNIDTRLAQARLAVEQTAMALQRTAGTVQQKEKGFGRGL